jgi:hypothetical protein
MRKRLELRMLGFGGWDSNVLGAYQKTCSTAWKLLATHGVPGGTVGPYSKMRAGFQAGASDIGIAGAMEALGPAANIIMGDEFLPSGGPAEMGGVIGWLAKESCVTIESGWETRRF